MKIYYTDHFVLPLPDGHRFPMAKYGMLRARVASSDVVPPGELCEPDAATDDELRLVHTPEYVARVVEGALSRDEQRRIGFPWSPELVERSRRSVGATIAASRFALRDGVAVSLAGGTHHAYGDRGEGYCVFNDAAVAARVLQQESGVRRVLIVDCDVHQGNGTAAVFAGDASVFTFGMYAAGNFPFRKEPCDLGIALPDGTRDERYLDDLERALPEALRRSGADFAIYLAGADPYRGDRLGRLALSKAGLRRRDELVLSVLRQAGVPVAVAMAGGYGHDVSDTVDIHLTTVRMAAAWWQPR